MFNNPTISKVAEQVSQFFRALTEPTPPLTYEDKASLYKQYRSFSGFLPYTEWLDEHDMLLLEDQVSVGCLWELEPIRSEGTTEDLIATVEQAFISATAGELERQSKHGNYVLSCFTSDDYSLEDEYNMIEQAIHPRWQGTELANQYLASTKKMLTGMESEKGLFKESMRVGSSDESTMRAYRGGKRRHRIMLYRRIKLRQRTGAENTRQEEIEQLGRVRSVIEAAIAQNTAFKRMGREDFHEMMLKLLNPFPAATNGNINALKKLCPCPTQEMAQVDGEYVLSMLHSKVETKSSPGVIEFDGNPARFLQIERLNRVPRHGALTSERKSNSGEVGTALDKLPAGSVFVQHIVFEDSDEKKEYLRGLEKRSRTVEDEAVIINEQCHTALESMAKGRHLYKTEMGLYLFAKNQKDLDKYTDQARSVLASELGIKAIAPESNLFPIESFIRNLPFVYDPFLDTRRRRGRTAYYHHSVRLMPFLGRTRGSIGRTQEVCHTYYNRKGEMILFDPMDFDGNAHTCLLGPSGMGKSATLNKHIVELLLFKNARIYLVEAGMSFDPLMDFLEAENCDVQRVNIGIDSNSKPVAPLGNAKLARDEFLVDAKSPEEIEHYIETVMNQLSEEGLLAANDDLDASKERMLQAYWKAQHRTGGAEKKDYMGECILLSKIMVTGGSAKEEQAFRLQDVSFLTRAIVEAANLADGKNEAVVTPSHLETALRQLSLEYKADNQVAFLRLQEMADNVSIYTTSVRGKVLNQQADPFKLCDCLHVELGLAQRDGNEDLLVLAFLSLMNMVNDVAESKAKNGDDRPIYFIVDESHLILKDERLAPPAVKIVRMWRKNGAWFVAATQDIAQSFVGQSAAILGISEIFIAIKPPPDDLVKLKDLAKLSDQDVVLVESARAEKRKFTEAVIINKVRSSAALVRIVQPSFTLALAGTDDAEKVERAGYMAEYQVRLAGATLIQAAALDLKRGLTTEEEFNQYAAKIADSPKFQVAA